MTAGFLKSPDSPKSQSRLQFLDGIRGLCALYITLHHAYFICGWNHGGGAFPGWFRWLTDWMWHGPLAVGVFIVLSGFCLMLPVVRSENGQLRGGVAGFARRRARRILPPYFAALGFSLLLIVTVPTLGSKSGQRWDLQLPAFEPGALLSHLLLVHNLSDSWIYKINSPLWSIATEWQIYFIFALLLHPVWRRLGTLAMAAMAAILGMGLLWALPALPAYPHYLTMFAMGAVAAVVCFGRDRQLQRLRTGVPWGALAFATGTGFAAALLLAPGAVWRVRLLAEFAVAVCAALLIVHGALSGRRIDWLNSRLLQNLGQYSYSLYLVHMPVLAALDVPIRVVFPDPLLRTLILLGTGVPIACLTAYGFHLLFERPLLREPQADAQASDARGSDHPVSPATAKRWAA